MTLELRDKYAELYEKYSPALTQTQNQILKLYLFEDLQIVEIAEIMVSSRQAVNDAIKKATKKLDKFA